MWPSVVSRCILVFKFALIKYPAQHLYHDALPIMSFAICVCSGETPTLEYTIEIPNFVFNTTIALRYVFLLAVAGSLIIWGDLDINTLRQRDWKYLSQDRQPPSPSFSLSLFPTTIVPTAIIHGRTMGGDIRVALLLFGTSWHSGGSCAGWPGTLGLVTGPR